MLRGEQLQEADERRVRHQHPSPGAAATAAHQDFRRSKPDRDARSTQPGEGSQAKTSGTRGERAGELEQKTTLPATREEIGVPLAPDFGGALEAQEDTHRREKVRYEPSVHRVALLPGSGGVAHL